MGWRIEHQAFENLVRVTADGAVTTEDVLAQVMQGIVLIKRHEATGALVDYSGAILEMPIDEIGKLPDLFESQQLPLNTRIAVALPADPVNMHKYTFFDDVATNRGYLVKLFWEPSRAMQWVLAK